MPRKKTELIYITDDPSRKSTLRKREKTLIQKMNEISILCDVKGCAIIHDKLNSEPRVWPSPAEAQNMVSEFDALPEKVRSKNVKSHETFLTERIIKGKQQIEKMAKKEARKNMFENLIHRNFGKFTDENLNQLRKATVEYLEKVKIAIDNKNNNPHEGSTSECCSNTISTDHAAETATADGPGCF